MDRANVAAQLMEHLCDHDSHGYSQASRWGEGGMCYVDTDAGTITLKQGDRDCSSAVCDCWQEAIRGTAYEGALDSATYTGNMRSVFEASGLFEWHDMSFSASRGDIYLNEACHTAMCICGDASNDILGEFSLAETGGIDGAEGDQTGWESHIQGYYDYPWDGILHYNGLADSDAQCAEANVSDDEDAEIASSVRYRVYTKEFGWHDWMQGLTDTGGSGDDYAGSEGCWIYGFEVEGHDYRIVRCDGSESVNGQGNEESAVCGIEVMGDVDYQVHWLGDDPGWGKWEHGSDDNGAGKDDGSPLDMVRCR